MSIRKYIFSAFVFLGIAGQALAQNYTAPTPPTGDNTNRIATTAFVQNTVSPIFGSQTANTFFAAPNGSAGVPVFRHILGADIPNPSASSLGGVQSKAAVSNQFLTSISTSGVPVSVQPAFSNLSGQATLLQLPSLATNTVLGNATSGTATPTALPLSGCSGASNALTWTTNSGFGCNNISGAPGFASPEDYGAVGNGSADDTTAFTNLCTAVRAGTVNYVRHTYGKTYKVLTGTPVAQTKLCDLTGITGLRWDFNGSPINPAYTDNTIVTYLFYLDGSKDVEMKGLKGTAAAAESSGGGVHWAFVQNDAERIAIRNIDITNGLTGVTINRLVGQNTLLASDIEINGKFTSIAYPVQNQFNGRRTRFDITTINAYRSYVGYNVSGVKGRIVSTNASLDDIAIGAYGSSGDYSANRTSDISIDYINLNSTVYGASILNISHNQTTSSTPVSNTPTTIENIYVNFDHTFNSSPNSSWVVNDSYIGNGLTTNVRSTGTVAGSVTPGDVITTIATGGAITGSPVSTAYTVVAGDTTTTIATNIAAAINVKANLISSGIFASSSGAVVSLWSPPSLTVAWTRTLSGGATETYTIAAAGSTSGNVTGDPGNIEKNIVLSGVVRGSVSQNNIAWIGSQYVDSSLSSSGFNGSSSGNFTLRDLQFPTSTKPLIIGSNFRVMMENVVAPSMNVPSYEGSPSIQQAPVIASQFANAGDAANVAFPAYGALRLANIPGVSAANLNLLTLENQGRAVWSDGTNLSGRIFGDTGGFYLQSLNAHDLFFYPNNTNSWKMAATGGHFTPASNNAFDIGATALRMRKVWTTDLDFSGTLTGTVPLSTAASTVTVADDTTTNATMYPAWFTAGTGNLPPKVSTTKLSFNPSTATLTTTTFSGALSGNATTSTSSTNAVNTAITDDTTTNATMYPTWVTANTGNLPQKVTSTKFTFNPSTGITAATGLNLSGLTASSAVATDGSKNLVSVTNTGSGNNVLATAPTVTGLLTDTIVGSSTTDSTTSTTGAFKTAGGLGVAKNIYSGATINAATQYNIGATKIVDIGISTYTSFYNVDGSTALALGGAGDTNNYYNNGSHIFRGAGGSPQWVTLKAVSNLFKGADVVAAGTITATGNLFHVTGTTVITSISGTNITAGTCITLIFDAITTLTDGSNLKMSGNFVTTADDTWTGCYDGTNWYEKARSVN